MTGTDSAPPDRSNGLTVAVTGASGLIGSALCDQLTASGHRPVRLVRRDPKPGAEEIHWDPAAGVIDDTSLEAIDAVVNLAGAPIGTRPWTKAYKEVCVSSRVNGTTLLAASLAGLRQPPRRLLSGSAIGIYGTGRPEPLTESSDQGEGFLAELCKRWEAAASPAVDAGISTAYLRTGLVLSSDGGLLGRLGPIFRLGLGGRLGDGDQVMSWISLPDTIAALVFLLEDDGASLQGPVNLCGPSPVSNTEFIAALANQFGRSARLHVPALATRLAGAEMSAEFLLADQRVVPRVLTEAGFGFSHPQIEGALSSLLG